MIRGHEAKPHSHPYMASLNIQDEKKMMCGGVLVQKNFVLTAAHCNGRLINVTLGAHNIQKQEKTQQVIQVKRTIPHPDYNAKNFFNDIMYCRCKDHMLKQLPKELPRCPSKSDIKAALRMSRIPQQYMASRRAENSYTGD
ncbi:granzyme B(G,H)-like [Desmodus rotundus]|uniref:granzyme B(G,H)-like n=1 Tax=Desmodus rotundus TaxID=9430 RepID=UPI002380E6E1|nr:granzyme B(G,H)-like [Desmodus rotundus]